MTTPHRASRLQLTSHAVERYIERVRPDLTPERSRRLLERQLPSARPLKVSSCRDGRA